MSPEAYGWDIRECAEELYIIEGLTFEQVAEALKKQAFDQLPEGETVSVSQLKRWGLDSVPTWTERRREYRRTMTSLRYKVMQAKNTLIDKVIELGDAQVAHGFRSMVSSGRELDLEAKERIKLPTPESLAEKHPASKLAREDVQALINAVYGS
jgi:hypothetical protein